MEGPFLTSEQARQLRILKVVHENPGRTGTWKKTVCEELCEMGLAELKPNLPFKHYIISQAGIARAEELGL
jgi:hypothetical protein